MQNIPSVDVQMSSGNMNFKAVLPYLLVYLSLAVASVLIAVHFWWIDPLSLSSGQLLALLGSAGLMFFGNVFLSVLITQVVFIKDLKQFIPPLKFDTEKLNVYMGPEKAKKLKIMLQIIILLLSILTFLLFKYSMEVYMQNELVRNGVVQTVTVKELRYNMKKNPFAHFKYEFNGKVYTTNLPANQLKEGETIEVVFSKNNPNIVDYGFTLSKE